MTQLQSFSKSFKNVCSIFSIALASIFLVMSCQKTAISDEPLTTNAAILPQFAAVQVEKPIVLGYFPSWSENWVSATNVTNSKIVSLPTSVTHVFLGFAKPNLTYTKGSFNISGTGIEVPYDGQVLKAVVTAAKQKGIQIILSLGGETYWGTNDAYNINYQQIKDLVDDIGFVGIDWDFEPNGSFAEIGNATNVNRFISFFNNSRAIMPRSSGYILACAPAGCGAFGGQTNDDPTSPYAYAKRNQVTGDSDQFLYSFTNNQRNIGFWGFASTGHMIPVFKAVGDKIDIVAYQGYNTGAMPNRNLMYDAYAYYANIYGFKIAAGIHIPNEPWGPYYTYTIENTKALAQYVFNGGSQSRQGKGDGLMMWQLLMNSAVNSAQNGATYANEISAVFGGTTVISPSAPTVNQTSVTVGTAITGSVNMAGTLQILKDGAQVSTQTVSSGAWTYTPSLIGSYTFKLSANGQTSAASATVAVTSNTVTTPATPTVNQTSVTVGTAITGSVASAGTLLVFNNGAQVSTQTVSVGAWTYTPSVSGSFTFKLSVNNVLSAASTVVTVTNVTTGGGTGGCGYPAYNTTNSYPTAGTRVFYNGAIYESKWWINAGEAPNPSNPWDAWKFIQNCTGGTGGGTGTTTPVTPTVNQTSVTVNTPITGSVAAAGTLLIFNNGTQVTTQAVTVGAWTYTPSVSGSFTFKLSVNNVSSAASSAVTVTNVTTGGGGSGCGYPAYDPTKSYPTAGTRVRYNGSIYESKWWINAGEAPNPSNPWDAWKFIQVCP
jgi:chitinase